MIAVGQKAPEFSLMDQNGEEISLHSCRGRFTVLYFYPKDNTSGCTKEAVDFTQLRERFEDLGAAVYGVSPDSTASHVSFVSKHALGISLLSDPSKETLRAYGAFGIKKNYGKEYEGVIRSTVIIAPDLTIAALWSSVKVQVKKGDTVVKHAEKVLEKLGEMTVL
ncbi:peroxiredoxin [Myxococcota bacterium]|nr:peroxiredoxin [Myxococcota bacterium]